MRKLTCLILFILSFFPFSFLHAGWKTFSTLEQFSAGEQYQTQIDTTSGTAYEELLFQWEDKTGSGARPDLRKLFALAYSTGQQTAVLFGGYSNSGSCLGDTWHLNTQTNVWIQQTITGGPSARQGQKMVAIDANTLFLFGGQLGEDNSYNNETWIYTFNPSSWTQLNFSTAPSPRAYFGMTRDTDHNKVVLFGGKTSDSPSYSSETWVFNINQSDVSQSSWSLKSPSGSPPSARGNASMAHGGGVSYLFGGYDGSYRKDLRTYDVVSNVWSLVNDGASLSLARQNAGLFYDSRVGKIAFFGGYDGAAFKNEVWYYDPSTADKWNQNVALNSPEGREVYGIVYMQGIDKALLFGGYGSSYYNDVRYLTFRDTGMFTSYYVDTPVTTFLQWRRITWEPGPSSDQVNGKVKFRIASSIDNNTWSAFLGPAGTTDTDDYYGTSGGSLISVDHRDRRYLKFRIQFSSNKYPLSPQISSVTVTWNVSPDKPGLSWPASGTSSSSTPVFVWSNSPADADGDTLTYEIRIATSADVESSYVFLTSAIPSGVATTSFSTTTALLPATWYYWRVRANDNTTDSLWSNDAYSFYVDTIAPSQVTDLAAAAGATSKSVDLTWTEPGNDNDTGSLSGGSYEVRYDVVQFATQAEYNAIPESRRRQGAIPPGSVSPGTQAKISVTGLSDATTYYFALKIYDPAGNASPMSAIKSAFTDASPFVTLLSPITSVSWSGTQEILWESGDPNNDPRTFTIYESSDNGASYGTVVASGLPNGTTSFLWNTFQTCNGTEHRIKVVAVEIMPRTLAGSATSPMFTVYNPNKAPVVTVTYPADGEALSGIATLAWSVADENLADSHAYDIYLSSDNGLTYGYHYTAAQPQYQLDTTQFKNGSAYALKIVATDSGLGNLQGTGLTAKSFAISNNNLAPREFSLLSPADGASHTLFGLEFTWEANGDPNAGDAVTYTLYYSTVSSFQYSSAISGLTGNSYTPGLSAFQDNTMYYWKVTAADQVGIAITCRETFRVTILSRSQTLSADGKVYAEITSALPAGSYLRIEKLERSGSQAIQRADQDTRATRTLRSLGEDVYRLAVTDINGTEVDVPSPRLTVRFQYPNAAGVPGNSYYGATMVPIENLRCALLDESQNRWVTAADYPKVDTQNRSISTALDRLGTITMIGAAAPASKVSGILNFPNPFCAGKESTRIRYVLTEDSSVKVAIYTLLGDPVWIKEYPAGEEGGKGQPTGYMNEISWDGKNGSGMLVANGMYLCEVKAGNERLVRKIGVIK